MLPRILLHSTFREQLFKRQWNRFIGTDTSDSLEKIERDGSRLLKVVQSKLNNYAELSLNVNFQSLRNSFSYCRFLVEQRCMLQWQRRHLTSKESKRIGKAKSLLASLAASSDGACALLSLILFSLRQKIHFTNW
jgi:hypothetical protein